LCKWWVTYMHIYPLSIASISVQNRSNDYQLVVGTEVAHASLVLGRIVWGNWVEVEFKGGSEG
jgi:hypothetical protein